MKHTKVDICSADLQPDLAEVRGGLSVHGGVFKQGADTKLIMEVVHSADLQRELEEVQGEREELLDSLLHPAPFETLTANKGGGISTCHCPVPLGPKHFVNSSGDDAQCDERDRIRCVNRTFHMCGNVLCLPECGICTDCYRGLVGGGR